VKQLELAQISKELYDSVQSLGRGRKILFDYAKKLAQAEKDYRQALAKEIMKLKSEGIQATIISDIARGNTASLLQQAPCPWLQSALVQLLPAVAITCFRSWLILSVAWRFRHIAG